MKYVNKILFKLFPYLYYYPDGEPKKCTICGSKCFSYNVTDRINYIPCEGYIKCKKCGATVSFLAYGSYQPDYMIEGAINEVYK